ncbi:S-formylglutathione hydrolase [Escovopsis weberi]|uniref:S-formylglutathione hydrolase n=1 Tax=Escovopsis weberi TaxID=150374 RepID=A0A0M8N1A9_ESCWE|nr:S-formylglutathione hydrolase [Escovopsis weberi]
MTGLTLNATIHSFGGRFLKLTHQSTSTNTPMNFTLFLPPTASPETPAPVLIYLSGLTCTPDNVTEKGFLHAHAAPLGLALLYPDTSPRGTDLPGEHDAWDFGSGAGFYVDAARAPWAAHYRMETYLAAELPALVFANFKELDATRVSIAGHSMGGHGALTLYLKSPGRYRSVSAWAPIANPSLCPWGDKAFTGYFGDEDRELWKRHDATELVKHWKHGPLNALVDVGTADNFYKQRQLLPENFEEAAKAAGIQGLTLRYQDGYDHSYFFISTFAEDHVKHAAKHLGLL